MEWGVITLLITLLITDPAILVTHIMVEEAIMEVAVIIVEALFMTMPEVGIIPHVADLLQQQEL